MNQNLAAITALFLVLCHSMAAESELTGVLKKSVKALSPESDPTSEPKPYVVLSGAKSGIAKASFKRIMSQAEWAELWKSHSKDQARTEHNVELTQQPDVDFKSCMVIAILAGSSSNTEGLRFVTASESETKIVIGLDWLTYQSREPGDAVTPYGFLVVPRWTKAIRIQYDTRGLGERIRREPPQWEDAHTFPALKTTP